MNPPTNTTLGVLVAVAFGETPMNRRVLVLVTFLAALPPIADAATGGWLPTVIVGVCLLPTVSACWSLAFADWRHERLMRRFRVLPAPEVAAAEGAVSVSAAQAGGELSIADVGAVSAAPAQRAS